MITAFIIATCVLVVILSIGAASVCVLFKVLDSIDRSFNELDLDKIV